MRPGSIAVAAICIVAVLAGSIAIFGYSVSSRTVTTTATTTTTITSHETQISTALVFSTLTETARPQTYTTASTSTETVTVTAQSKLKQDQDQVSASMYRGNLSNYILVGGQNGTWFRDGQYPRLSVVSLNNLATSKLLPIPAEGTVWSGGWNGSEWLISGWGENASVSNPSNPYLDLYNGSTLSPISSDYTKNNSVLYSQIDSGQESEWNGGDIFAASSNGTDWFVSGLGSGILASYSSNITNHFSAGLFNGTYFTDLSSELPEQYDGILYANAYNGSEWLVGGGWMYRGSLFSFNGTAFADLTSDISDAVSNFNAITSIAWNGQYWLVGGVGFLASYNGSVFTDLTQDLNETLGTGDKLTTSGQNAVNSIVWNGTTWLLGGGLAKAYDSGSSAAWIVSYNSTTFTDLTGLLPSGSSHPKIASSVISIVYAPVIQSWIIGGYRDNESMLVIIQNDGRALDVSGLVSDMTYVNWIGIAS
jgi:hypothetical protein